ncbi:hypothetical protein MKZ38_006844 [Zalerion maritima]|uniref:Uncharacterized protein n=1 Tax=Zalerion maritima TaxID=339359 RepID=A0AAD5RJN6_9PEZI|nr:hypothetical protein MKZ38_006844 [Zalerion maritima]
MQYAKGWQPFQSPHHLDHGAIAPGTITIVEGTAIVTDTEITTFTALGRDGRRPEQVALRTIVENAKAAQNAIDPAE